MAKTRIMIVDDHEVVRLGMRAAFEAEPDLAVVGEASNGAEALAKMPVLDPELILMDVRMEKMDGIEACREIKSRYPGVIILMITSYPDEDAVISSILAGASGYLVKRTSPAEILTAIKEVHSGASPMSGKIARTVVEYFQKIKPATTEKEHLSKREKEILSLLVKGKSYKAVASECFISIDTVSTHVRHIYEKLHVHSKSEAVAKAINQKLI